MYSREVLSIGQSSWQLTMIHAEREKESRSESTQEALNFLEWNASEEILISSKIKSIRPSANETLLDGKFQFSARSNVGIIFQISISNYKFITFAILLLCKKQKLFQIPA